MDEEATGRRDRRSWSWFESTTLRIRGIRSVCFPTGVTGRKLGKTRGTCLVHGDFIAVPRRTRQPFAACSHNSLGQARDEHHAFASPSPSTFSLKEPARRRRRRVSGRKPRGFVCASRRGERTRAIDWCGWVVALRCRTMAVVKAERGADGPMATSFRTRCGWSLSLIHI